jgi:hypothetical protein
MKKSFSGLGSKFKGLLAGVALVMGLTNATTQFDAPRSHPMKRSGKSSGGKAKIKRYDERKIAWKKLFGGLAVPAYQD